MNRKRVIASLAAAATLAATILPSIASADDSPSASAGEQPVASAPAVGSSDAGANTDASWASAQQDATAGAADRAVATAQARPAEGVAADGGVSAPDQVRQLAHDAGISDDEFIMMALMNRQTPDGIAERLAPAPAAMVSAFFADMRAHWNNAAGGPVTTVEILDASITSNLPGGAYLAEALTYYNISHMQFAEFLTANGFPSWEVTSLADEFQDLIDDGELIEDVQPLCELAVADGSSTPEIGSYAPAIARAMGIPAVQAVPAAGQRYIEAQLNFYGRTLTWLNTFKDADGNPVSAPTKDELKQFSAQATIPVLAEGLGLDSALVAKVMQNACLPCDKWVGITPDEQATWQAQASELQAALGIEDSDIVDGELINNVMPGESEPQWMSSPELSTFMHGFIMAFITAMPELAQGMGYHDIGSNEVDPMLTMSLVGQIEAPLLRAGECKVPVTPPPTTPPSTPPPSTPPITPPSSTPPTTPRTPTPSTPTQPTPPAETPPTPGVSVQTGGDTGASGALVAAVVTISAAAAGAAAVRRRRR